MCREQLLIELNKSPGLCITMDLLDEEFYIKIKPLLGEKKYSIPEMIYDPLVFIMEEDSLFYQIKENLLEDILYGMWYWLRRSRRLWYAKIASSLSPNTPHRLIIERLNPIVIRQDTVYLMSLFKILQNNNSKNALVVIGNFINQMFIEHPQLLKECHRPENLYRTELIPKLVQLVPAMHATLDYAMKLLQMDILVEFEDGESFSTFNFASLLISEIAITYPNPKTLEACKNLIELIKDKSINDISEIDLTSFGKIAITFPNLISDFSNHLKQWQSVPRLKICLDSLIEKIKVVTKALQKHPNTFNFKRVLALTFKQQ